MLSGQDKAAVQQTGQPEFLQQSSQALRSGPRTYEMSARDVAASAVTVYATRRVRSGSHGLMAMALRAVPWGDAAVSAREYWISPTISDAPSHRLSAPAAPAVAIRTGLDNGSS